MGRRKHIYAQHLPIFTLRRRSLLQQLEDFLRLMKNDQSVAMVASWFGTGAAAAFIIMKWLPPLYKTNILTGANNAATSNSKRQVGSSNSEHEPLTVPGLKNAGSNCFINVVLQALASCKALVEFLSDCAERSKCFNKCDDEQFDMPLVMMVANLLEELCELGPAHRILNPRNVIRVLDAYARNFDLTQQQDAVEALAHLAAALQKEIVQSFERCRPILYSFSFDSIEQYSLNPSWSKTHMVDKKILRSWTCELRWPLGGTFGSILKCETCKFQFTVDFQVFNEVPLLPQWDEDGKISSGSSLEDCLSRLPAPSRISDVMCSRCSHLDAAKNLFSGLSADMATLKSIRSCSFDEHCSCRALMLQHGGIWNIKRTDAYQSLRIGRVPEVLCLQIQRAVVMDSGRVQKLMGHVSFPEILDLSPYMFTAQHPVTPTEAECVTPFYRSMLQLRNPGLSAADSRTLPLCDGTLSLGKGHIDCVKSQAAGTFGIGNHLAWQEDLNEWIKLPREGHDGGSFFTQEQDSESNLPIKQDEREKRVLFELLAVIVHLGDPKEGHYMVYRKVKALKEEIPSPASDSSVKFTGLAQVVKESMIETDCSISDATRKTLEDDLDDHIDKLLRAGSQQETGSHVEVSDMKCKLKDASHQIKGLCKTEDSLWFLVSDTVVKSVSKQEVFAADASLLLFGRISSTL